MGENCPVRSDREAGIICKEMFAKLRIVLLVGAYYSIASHTYTAITEPLGPVWELAGIGLFEHGQQPIAGHIGIFYLWVPLGVPLDSHADNKGCFGLVLLRGYGIR